MDFDHTLEKCGNFGRFQFALLVFYGYTNFLSSLHYFAQSFISFTPNHWCYHESLTNLTFNEIEAIYASTPEPSCTLLEDVINGTAIVDKIGKCRQWIYDYESGYESITTEMNWVCGDGYKLAVGNSMFFVGSVIGTIFFGFLADRIGRLPAMVLTSLTGASGDFLTSFVHSLPVFALGRLISGLSNDTIFYLMYIMVFEYLSPKRRTFGLNIMTIICYGCGLMLSPWFAIWMGSWRKYLLVASLPALGVLIYPLFICESAQWLITKKKYQSAVKCLKHVAKFNKRQVDEAVFNQFVAYYEQKFKEADKLQDKKDTFMGMFRTPRLRKFIIILMIKSMIITLTFDIISRNMEGLGSSPFMLFSYTSIVYLPGGLTIILLQNIIGRKGMACSCLFVGGIITATTGFLIAFLDRNEYALLLACMVGLGRYGANVAYDAEAQYATEIIPASVRGRGVANIHVVGYAIAFLSAYILYLGNYYKPMPSLFIAAIMLIGSVLCLLLPETQNKTLPETLADGEVFGLHEKWYYFVCFGGKQAEQRVNPEGGK